jgi:CRP-like cAMP-binding protein
VTPVGKARPFGDLLLPDDRERLLSLGSRASYGRGEQIFHEGDPSTYVTIIQSGEVKIVRRRADGNDLILALRGPNDMIGDMAAITGMPRSAGAVAMSEVEARHLKAEDFKTFVTAAPHLSWALIEYMAERQRDTEQWRVDLASASVAHRVAAELLDLAERRRDSGTTDGGFLVSQGEIAEVVGASREAIAKALSEFRKQGWITTGRRRVSIVDRERLVELVGD